MRPPYNPKKRNVRLQKKYVQDDIEINTLKKISKIPKVVRFRSTIELSIHTEKKLKTNNLNSIKTLKKTPITIYEKPNKRNQKTIYNSKFKKLSSNSFSLRIIADGGLPIKRFVEGNNIQPNLSELLGNRCRCKEFDFHKIELMNSQIPHSS